MDQSSTATDVKGARPQANRRVAVIVPMFGAHYIEHALRSVLAQTRRPDEIIVVDDGSPDRAGVTRALAPFGNRITLIRQVNQGAAAARNRGIAATSAEYIAMLDADDEWFPSFLTEQLAVLTSNPGIDLVYSDGVVTGRTGLAGQRFMASCPSEGPVTLDALLAQRCTVLLSSVVARRQAIVDAGGFDLSLRRGQDFDLWLRMAHQGARLAYQRKVLVLRRIHEDNLSGSAINEQERPLRVLEKTLRTMRLSPRQREIAQDRVRCLNASLARERGKKFLEEGDFAGAQREFERARQGQFSWKIYAALAGLRVAPHVCTPHLSLAHSIRPGSSHRRRAHLLNEETSMSTSPTAFAQFKRLVPRPVKGAVRRMFERQALADSLRQLGRMPPGEVPSRALLEELQLGWANHGMAARTDYLAEVCQQANTSDRADSGVWQWTHDAAARDAGGPSRHRNVDPRASSGMASPRRLDARASPHSECPPSSDAAPVLR
jgi:glycosyltransferase involved in cell wall biosynthesis